MFDLEREIVSQIASWITILGVLLPTLGYVGKQFFAFRKKQAEEYEKFKEFTAVLVNAATTAVARNDIGNYLNIANRQWQVLALKAYIQTVGTIMVVFPLVLIASLWLVTWEKYLIIGTSVLAVIGQIITCMAISRRFETHSQVILEAWSQYVETHWNKHFK